MGNAMQPPTTEDLQAALELTAAYKDLAVAVGDNRAAAAEADSLSRLIDDKSAESKELHRQFAARYAMEADERVKPKDLAAVLSELSGLYYRYQEAIDDYASANAAIEACHDRVVELQAKG